MREEIRRLINLQTLDQELREQQEALSNVSGRVDELRETLERAQAELDQIETEDQQATLARRELERELAEGEAEIRNKRMRISAVRNEKELQALTHEVETLKESNQRLEAEVLARMEAAEQRTPRIKELTELVGLKRKELSAAEKEVAGQVEDLKSAITKRRIERDRLAGQIETSLRQRYEIIFSRRAGVAVVEAKSGTCQGCRMRIPPQLYNEIQRKAKIQFCPNCQRILYFVQ